MSENKSGLPADSGGLRDGTRGEKTRKPGFVGVPLMTPPSRAAISPWTWPRRIAVWSVTGGACLWAVYACGHALMPGRAAPPTAGVAQTVGAAVVEPSSAASGVDPFEKPRGLFEAGEKLLRAGDMSGIETLEQVLKSYPDTPQARKAILALAATYRFQKGQPEKAAEYYVRFVQQFPDDLQVPNAVQRLRELYAELHQPDLSDRYVRDAMAKVEKDPRVTARLQKLLDRR